MIDLFLFFIYNNDHNFSLYIIFDHHIIIIY